ncbi:hypothetical protein NE237_000401 [Protea cynaroides]|uniref:Transmembrane protein n=1 Tax=Protea cynaroides TaxID=273540 RepID=A0A9Q0QX39_9MAGN|nr:hypothetical protein NE237_000401 [Protea cynaroides]
MEKSLLNLEKPIKDNLTEKTYKSNRFSISAFVFFIFICFSMVHFHPSPSELFHNTKFWFLLSNALILIIAADSGAFSSSKQKYDIYEEYMMNSRARNASSFVPDKTLITNSKPTIATSIIKAPPLEIEKLPESIQEHVLTSDNSENLEEDTTETSEGEETYVEDACETNEIQRSRSQEVISVTGNENKKSLIRSATEGCRQRSDENEFSTMSDEELNRRVEEFIRFNRQMRLQESRGLGGLEN